MKMKMVLTVGFAGCVLVAVGVAQTPSAADLYQEALRTQEVKGDLVKAVELFRSLVDRYPADRAIVPKALLELASCYEKLGKPEAARVYQRIVTEYASSGAVATTARAKLVAIAQKGAGLVARQVWDRAGRAVSADGRYLAFFDDSDRRLSLHDIASGKDILLTSSAPGSASWGQWPVPSPDSRLIAYNWLNGEGQSPAHFELRVIGRDGGQPHVAYVLTDKTLDSVLPLAWSRDGKSILAKLPTWSDAAEDWTRDFLWIPAAGGAPRLVKHFEANKQTPTPDLVYVSPDDRFIAYDRTVTAGKPEHHLYSSSTTDGPQVSMLAGSSDDRMLAWFPEGGRILFLSDRGGTYGLWAARVTDGRVQGEPMLIKNDIGREIFPMGFTGKGEFFYSTGGLQAEVYLATLDPTTGKQTGALARLPSRYAGVNSAAAWSPTGDRIVYVQSVTSGNLVIQTVSTGVERVLPTGLKNLHNPTWLAGGRGVIFQGAPLDSGFDGYELHVMNAETGVVTALAGRDGASVASGRRPAVSPDGRRVFYIGDGDGIVTRDLTGGAEQVVNKEKTSSLALSPDGQWLAVTRRSDSIQKVSVISSSSGQPKPLATVVNSWSLDWATLAWSADGRFVFVAKRPEGALARKGGAEVLELWQIPVDGTAPRNTGITWSGGISRISVSPDGRLAVSTNRSSRTTWVLQNLPPQRER